MKPILKKLLPVVAALAVFYALSILYFSPALEGKRLIQGDLKNWQGMAQEIAEHRELTGEDPLWTGSMFSGMPAYQITVLWPQNLLRFADAAFHGFLPRPMSFLFLYLVGMYILLRCLRVDPWLSIVGAIAFGFSSYFFVILEAGHNSKANAIGYAPMVLGALHVLLRGNRLLGAALLALFLGLEVMMNHVQVTYYLGFVLVLYTAAEAVRALRERQVGELVKRGALGIGAVALALACNLGMLWTTYEYGAYTTRGRSELTIQPDGSPAARQSSGLDREYVTAWSYGKQESFSLLVPNAKGGASASMIQSQEDFRKLQPPAFRNAVMKEYQNGSYINAYWGDQSFTSGPVYVGAIAILLMLLMAASREGRESWWMLGGALLLLVLIAIDNNAVPAEAQGAARFMGMDAAFVMGALVILWLAAGLWAMRDALVYALFAALVLTLALGWGRNLMPLTDFFLDHVPGYSKFRAVTIILVIVELAVPVLGILWLDRTLREGAWDKRKERRFLLVAGSLAAIVLVIALFPGLFNLLSDAERLKFDARMAADPGAEAEVLTLVEGIKDHRAGVLSADAWRSLGFVVAGAAVIWLLGRRKLGAGLGTAALGVLILADQWSVDKRYVNNEKDKGRYRSWEDEKTNQKPHKPNAADLAILQAEWNPKAEALHQENLERIKQARSGERGSARLVSKDDEQLARFASLRRATDYRVLWMSDPFNDSRVSYFHKSVGGYHGAKLERYQELIEFHLRPAINRVGGLFGPGATLERLDSALAREGVLNMLNTRHLIYSNERPPLLNTNALGSAWFVEELRWARSADEEITALGTIDPARVAVADERFKGELGDSPASPDPSASVTLDDYATDRLTYTARSAKGGVIVFSAIWYGPDWQAYIDDQPVPHGRVNYVLRGLRVPPGEHRIIFKVEGRAAARSRPVMLAASALVLLFALGLLGLEARKAIGLRT